MEKFQRGSSLEQRTLVDGKQGCLAINEQMTFRYKPCQTGVALLTVLLIVFLASMTATHLAFLQQLTIRRSTLLEHRQQALLYTLGAEQWAAVMLKRDRENSNKDDLNELWAKLPPALPIQGGYLTGQLQDLQGRFNINNLLKLSDNDRRRGEGQYGKQQTDAIASMPNAGDAIDVAQFETLQRLLLILELEPELAQAIVDWLDPDQEPRFPGGAEDSAYVTHTPPYLAANRPLVSLSELRLIKGIDKEVYAKLAPYLCTLPPGTELNVNTAPPPVLAALGDDIGLPRAENLVETRDKGNQNGYDSVTNFLNAFGIEEETFATIPLTVSSRYFLLQAEAQVGEGRALLHSIIHRPDSGNMRILLRRFGNDD